MEKIVFYSWQSDLPNNENRGFIESCVKAALKEINDFYIAYEAVLDRDTKNASGTPDIAESIFNKIDQTNIFIADISLIGELPSGKKTPNPNVLIELGYAANKIGWENVLCVFNERYGKVEELPFDLRFRKPIIYSIKDTNDKSNERKALSQMFVKEFSELLKKQSAKESLYNHFKIKVDSEILCLSNDLKKIIWGYEKEFNPNIPFELTQLSDDEIGMHIKSRKILGFQVLKSVSSYINKLEEITQNPVFSIKIEEEIIAAIVQLINTLHLYETNIRQRGFFKPSNEKEDKFELIQGEKMNPENPKDSYLLLEKMDGAEGRVTDSGTIPKYAISEALTYMEFEQDLESIYLLLIKDLIDRIDHILKLMGNKLLIDPATFKMN